MAKISSAEKIAKLEMQLAEKKRNVRSYSRKSKRLNRR